MYLGIEYKSNPNIMPQMSKKVQNASDVILVGFQHLIYGMDRKTISREVEARGV